ncbi:MAG TPA: hypothetical protein VG847_15660, partial [Chitinophagaceae bacterium]|nr:hypothetical protein [Chitinophagaceae bacterium]
MKSKLLLLIFFTPAFLTAFSQQSSVAYAITGQGKGGTFWSDIRALDMRSGNALSTLFENGQTKFSFIDAETGRTVDASAFSLNAAGVSSGAGAITANNISYGTPSPTSLMSAAVAYDKRHDKLFFATMK